MRHADHVPLAAGRAQVVEEPAEVGVVVAIGQMQDDLGVGIHRLGGGVSAVDELAQGGEVGRLALVPQHAAVDLVAHLHPADGDAVVLEVFEDALGVAVHIGVELGNGVAGPCRRLGLFARVGPAVAVVEVDHDAHALRGGALGLVQGVAAIVPAAERVDPDAQANGVAADILEQLDEVGGVAGCIAKDLRRIVGGLLIEPADVRAFGDALRADAGAAQTQQHDEPYTVVVPAKDGHETLPRSMDVAPVGALLDPLSCLVRVRGVACAWPCIAANPWRFKHGRTARLRPL